MFYNRRFKSPLGDLWNADDEAAKSDYLDKHVAAVKTHIHNISKNGYWKNLKSSLDFVVVVMPEYALLPALDRDNTLNEFAMEKHVVLVTPSTV